MSHSWIYIAVAVAILAAVALLVFAWSGGGNRNTLTPLAGLAFGFVISGIIFGDDRYIGYGLLGVGVLLAVIDMVRRRRHAK